MYRARCLIRVCTYYFCEALEKDALDAKRTRWLAFHDQKTSGIMGLLPLVKGLPVRLTSALNRGLKLFKNSRCTIEGWTLSNSEARLCFALHRVSRTGLYVARLGSYATQPMRVVVL